MYVLHNNNYTKSAKFVWRIFVRILLILSHYIYVYIYIYFIIKALFVLNIFKFLLWIFDHIETNGWIRKIRLISKAMVSQPDLQKFSIHILPNISRSKFNQKMKFGQGIEYNQRNIFLQKTCRNKSGRLVLDLPCFFKKNYLK